MLKKLCSLVLMLAMLFSSVGVSFASSSSSAAQGRLAAIEADTYGTEQTGAVIDRLNRLERDFDGSHRTGSIMARIDAIYDELYTNSTQPSMLTELNAIEWNIDHEVGMGSLQSRIAELEITLFGKNSEGTFAKRIAELSKASFGTETLPIEPVTVPANTLVKIELTEAVNAKNLKAGDIIDYKVAEDVIVNNSLVFARGSRGEGVVEKVRQARNFGRNAKVEIDFNNTKAIDGTFVSTFVGEEAKKELEQLGMAAGASLAGIAILGPIGIVGGAFVHGKNVDLPAGTELFVQTTASTTVYGVMTTYDPVYTDASYTSTPEVIGSEDDFDENDDWDEY